MAESPGPLDLGNMLLVVPIRHVIQTWMRKKITQMTLSAVGFVPNMEVMIAVC